MDTIKYVSNSVKISDQNLRQELLNSLEFTESDADKNAMDVIENFETLDPDFVNQILIPKIVALKTPTEIERLKLAVQTNSDLKGLVEKFTFTDRSQDVLPVAKTDDDIMRNSPTSSTWEDMQSWTEKVLNL